MQTRALRGAGGAGELLHCRAPLLASAAAFRRPPDWENSRSDEKWEGTVMTFTDRAPRRSTNPEEWFSILLALMATIGGAIFIGYYPQYKPTEAGGGVAWAVPVWIGFFYLIIQMTFLLFSASQIRALGVLDRCLRSRRWSPGWCCWFRRSSARPFICRLFSSTPLRCSLSRARQSFS